MKKTFKYIAALVVTIISGFTVYAQNLDEGTYKEENGVAYAKRAIIEDDGTYTIDLETFVTGAVTQTFEVHPADVVLVLDVSGSMNQAINEYVYTSYTSDINGNQYNNWDYSNPKATNPQVYYNYNDYYYPVSIGRGGNSGSRHYYLCFSVNGTRHYITTTGQVTTTEPTNAGRGTNLNTQSVNLYTRTTQSSGTTKIAALKEAVEAFILQIQHNDFYEDDTDSKPRKDEQGNPKPLGNQISIVKFADDSYYNYTSPWGTSEASDPNAPITPGNHFNGSYNRTEVLRGFTPTSSQANVDDLIAAINGITAGGATAADYGMNLARNLINSLDPNERSDSRKTVVFFTDGEPNHQSGFDSGVATTAIQNSGVIKAITYTETYEEDGQQKTRTVHPSVFSVAEFGSKPEPGGDLENYMNYVSSNFPDATAYNNGGTRASSDYYMDASGGSADDLKKIFTAIAHSAGGSGNTDVSGGSTLTVDVVSSSFSVPKNVSASTAITVLVAPCTGKTTIGDKEYLTFGAAGTPQSYGLPAITPNIIEADNKVTTTGFDYSANWCGPDPTSTSTIQPGYHGFKQIIRFTITVNDDAVGGPAVETNDPTSGIYLPGEDEPLIKFNRPNVKLPVQIWIQKQGLKGDESAVFNLRRIKYRGTYETDENGDYKLDEDGNPIRIRYEDIPKNQWDTFTKIVINNEDMDENGLVKVVGLDPDYVYRLDEDVWAFGYTYQDGGIQYTIGDNIENPFTFINIPKEIKFDEASARNIFNEKKAQ